MIIEDDPETQFLFSEILMAEGYDVVAKDNGDEALKYLGQSSIPDLIFMDLTFPGSTPEEFADKLRGMSNGNNVPLILVSGKADIADYAQRMNAAGFLKKPFDIDPLLALVQKTL